MVVAEVGGAAPTPSGHAGKLTKGPVAGGPAAASLRTRRHPRSADISRGASASMERDAAADGDHHYFLKPPPQSDPVREFLAPFQSFDLERVQDSQDVMCGICMDKVWDKPEEAERLFGILPNCSHAHCLGCLRAWRKSRGDFPPGVIKACPQCRVHSSYIIPCRFWVSQGPEKEQLIRNFKARTSQIQCRFFMRGNGRCPFKSDCIYLHQLPDEAPSFDPLWPESMQLASVVGTPVFLGGTEPDEEVFFMDCALGMAFWGSELLLDPNSSYNCLL
ncbi:E3 ubiquitin-protein ligase makorin isoform X7 [Bubalus bubalis]|uniref:E3 ubiquitin-protein ligase makorin isoform X7 n=1 Tax=Bubalus bubalis TaxID=89462 RepID=UPI001D12B269|nr:E3 ubiquitin-protein ligase makorin isoform X7 [Bubalus bubalis]